MKTKPNRISSLPGSSAKISGFTLVELLVVITIIAVLASIVIVMTQKIRTRAQQANALSSLRQVGMFHVSYAMENAGDINTLRWDGDKLEGKLGGGGNAWVSNTFWGRFRSFLFSDSPPTDQKQLNDQLLIRICQLMGTPTPARGEKLKMKNTVISDTPINYDTSGLPVPLAFNADLATYNRWVKVSSVSDPSQVLYATYGSGQFNENDGKAYAPMPRNGVSATSKIYYLDDRKALFIFVDGHVEALAAPIAARKFK